jgi:hypothetical protein
MRRMRPMRRFDIGRVVRLGLGAMVLMLGILASGASVAAENSGSFQAMRATVLDSARPVDERVWRLRH